jgi:hypothetical protein
MANKPDIDGVRSPTALVLHMNALGEAVFALPFLHAPPEEVLAAVESVLHGQGASQREKRFAN